ncbi:MAG: NADH-quinone oxidoreductase subunit [Pseudomonadota bacterium]|jgi:NADH-quinone oxidoreductase subunit C
MTLNTQALADLLQQVLGSSIVRLKQDLGEVTIDVAPADYHVAAMKLRDTAGLKFDQMIDLCGMDYSTYGGKESHPQRFAAIVHLLSVELNQRVRLRVYAPDDQMPVLDSVVDVWTAANWFEREAFDLYGILFVNHPDLRRILTDYGFVGHPFRKDFPVSGYVEMRYDEEQKRVIYQPVTIEPRENTPRIVRESTYGEPAV